jgi:hypothetical protein
MQIHQRSGTRWKTFEKADSKLAPITWLPNLPFRSSTPTALPPQRVGNADPDGRARRMPRNLERIGN